MIRSAVLTLTLCLATVTAQAALVSRAGGQAYYDTDTNLTWVADANLAQTSGYDADGRMDWATGSAWIGSLNTASYLGATDWRLPTVTDSGAPGCVLFGYTGTDCGYNVDLATGEMARMFYGTLGNTGYYDTSGVLTGCSGAPTYCLTSVGPFSNLQPYYYWTSTKYALDPVDNAWLFSFASGYQGYDFDEPFYAWALRDGDIAAVPIPAAVWLFGSALGLMGGMRRKVGS